MTATNKALAQRAGKIRLAIFDVDGVLSDGRISYTDDGRELKAFHVQDGYGMKRLMANGIMVAIITARTSRIVTQRMNDLGIDHVYQGQRDKRTTFESLIKAHDIQPNEVSYTGDDLLDLPVMTRVGLAVAPADAHPEVQRRAHWVTARAGGHGAAREVCDLILQASGHAERELALLDLSTEPGR
jgi:3-deoxy-D-manno-octulosonate 8-phosphate phosphatase (KDO 8-P phosphatase)